MFRFKLTTHDQLLEYFELLIYQLVFSQGLRTKMAGLELILVCSSNPANSLSMAL